MPNWIGEKYGAEAQRMWEHVFDNCEEKGYSSNCYEYATGTVEEQYGGKSMKGYKAWRDSVMNGDFSVAADELTNDESYVQSQITLEEYRAVMEGVAKLINEAVNLLNSAGMFPEAKITDMRKEVLEPLSRLTNNIAQVTKDYPDVTDNAKFSVALNNIDEAYRKSENFMSDAFAPIQWIRWTNENLKRLFS